MRITNRNKKSAIAVIISTALIISFQNCSPNKIQFSEGPLNIDPLARYELDDSGSYSTFFKYQKTHYTNITQQDLGNVTNVIKFRVDSASPISAKDLIIKENGKEIKKFVIESDGSNSGSIGNVDIALVIDDTGSMGSTIESVKVRLTAFIDKMYDSDSNARICISTFGDSTTSKCNKFFSINKKDPNSPTERAQLINQLNSIRASGGGDSNENPMRAILDSLSADWETTNQKFIILVTDAGFSHAGNPGNAGSLAPAYSEVVSSLTNSDINIFAATPDLAGYNKAFGTDKGIVDLTDGEWFNYSNLVSGSINFDTILERIMKRVNSFYTIRYSVRENGLNESLTTSERKVEVSVPGDSSALVLDKSLVSTHPKGVADYKKVFQFANKEFDPASVKISVNRSAVDKSKYTVDKVGNVSFATAPTPNAVISVQYDIAKIEDGMTMSSIIFAQDLDPNSLYVTLNGKKVAEPVYKLEQSLEGRYTLQLSESVFDSAVDPYKIRSKLGLDINVKYLYKKKDPAPSVK